MHFPFQGEILLLFRMPEVQVAYVILYSVVSNQASAEEEASPFNGGKLLGFHICLKAPASETCSNKHTVII